VRTTFRVGVVILMLGVSACGAADGTSSHARLLPGTEQHAIAWGAARRTYLLHVGAELLGGSRPQLVVVLHGASLSAAQTERYYHWDDLADARGFAVAYPQGIHDAWNAGSCCADAPRRRTDDVGFIAAVMADATSRSGADPSRVYLTGVSNGAMMTLLYECARPGRLAAIGSVAGTFTSPCDHPPPIPFIAVHGLADQAVTFEKTSSTVESGPHIRLPAAETIDRFLASDACHDPQTLTAGTVHTLTATCAPGLSVEVITIDGAGHQWPGATIESARLAVDGPNNHPSRAINATAELWSFFSAHELKPSAGPTGS
jgi:polyhydroxybutyrate depolymerase